MEESCVSVACATRAFLRARIAAPVRDLEGIVVRWWCLVVEGVCIGKCVGGGERR